MTDPTKLLALASRSIPTFVWYEKNGRICTNVHSTWQAMDGPVAEVAVVDFDPRNNAEQAIEVWLWLVANHRAQDTGGVIDLGPKFGRAYGSKAEWCAAVTEAGMRVVG